MKNLPYNGFVSIITVLFLSVLVTMFTLGFARIMLKGQQNTLNSQLNSQAFYAAETGINDAIKAIKAGYVPPIEDTDCAPLNPNTDTVLQKQIPIEYTCQLVSSGVKDIQYSANADSPRTFPLFTNGILTNGKDVSIDWEDDTDYIGSFHGGTDLPKASEWPAKTPAMLRVTFLYLPTSATRDSFNNNAYQKTIFITPADYNNQTDPVYRLSELADGSVVQGGCKSNIDPINRLYACRTSFSASKEEIPTWTPETYNTVFVRVVPVYHKTNLDVYFNTNGRYDETTPNRISLYNAQYSIDVTGRSNDIYRRIQVRLPYRSVSNPPNGVLSGEFCKKYQFDKTINSIVSEGCAP